MQLVSRERQNVQIKDKSYNEIENKYAAFATSIKTSPVPFTGNGITWSLSYNGNLQRASPSFRLIFKLHPSLGQVMSSSGHLCLSNVSSSSLRRQRLHWIRTLTTMVFKSPFNFFFVLFCLFSFYLFVCFLMH